jgi:hypothetical protein
VKRQPFVYGEEEYDLKHLDPCTFVYVRPAVGTRPQETYKVDTIFTSHCFTRGLRPSEVYDPSLVYADGDPKPRLFDLRRYELSKQLPKFIQELPTTKPHHNSNRLNFFSIVLLSEEGEEFEYDIFFKIKKSGKGKLEMIVETAFVREPEYDSVRPNGMKVGFWIILYNTLHERKIAR